MTCKCSKNPVTGDVLVTINASSADDALAIARNLPGFTLDEFYGALELSDGQYLVTGNAGVPINDASVVSVCPNGVVHTQKK